jgi:hypothetical protein
VLCFGYYHITKWVLPESCRGSPALRRQKADHREYGYLRQTRRTSLLHHFHKANTSWPEIVNAINGKPWQTRPDIVNRVFKLKLNEFIKDIKSGSLFGTKAVYIQGVVEFQLRGVPHAHILVRMDRGELSAQEVDEFWFRHSFLASAVNATTKTSAINVCVRITRQEIHDP